MGAAPSFDWSRAALRGSIGTQPATPAAPCGCGTAGRGAEVGLPTSKAGGILVPDRAGPFEGWTAMHPFGPPCACGGSPSCTCGREKVAAAGKADAIGTGRKELRAGAQVSQPRPSRTRTSTGRPSSDLLRAHMQFANAVCTPAGYIAVLQDMLGAIGAKTERPERHVVVDATGVSRGDTTGTHPELPNTSTTTDPFQPDNDASNTPGCYRYSAYAAYRTATAPCGDTYDYLRDPSTGVAPEFQLCLNITGWLAVESLDALYETGWEQALWNMSGLRNHLDAHLGHEAFDGNIADDDEERLWREWDAEEVGYTPACSATPRRKVMQVALWLIASLKEGVPETYDDWAPRENIVDPIVAGEMDFRLYTPEGGGNRPLEFSGWAVGGSNCNGVQRQFLLRLPGQACSKTGVPCECVDPAIATARTISDCSLSETVVDLRETITFEWGYEGYDPTVGAESGNNHAWRTGLKRVFLCTLRVDRAAIMYDWFLALSAAHFLASHDPTMEPTTARQHQIAAHYALRMGLAVAAELAAIVIHETAHNMSLYHCTEPNGTLVGCVEDAARRIWRAYATARLGLPWINHVFNAPDSTSTVVWNWALDLTPSNRAYTTALGAIGGTYFTYRESNAVECQQGNELGPELQGLTDFWEDEKVGTILEVVGGILVVAGAFLGGGWGAVKAGVTLIVVGALADRTVEALTPAATDADLEFTIDMPLTPGAIIPACCIYNRNQGAVCASTSDTPCWPTSPPAGFTSCCSTAPP